ncbi:hypothetical protein SO802_028813 [Lithocarpus litseifolius]|uniref:Aminotransferase-like plant mobile domain-containing protein n=1 Tax=Lithocarpus litseifolius TaxID=425828 RepID=A0AAW2BUH5_9ROSI
MLLPQRTIEERIHMARAFLLYLLGDYLFANGRQMLSLRWLILFHDFTEAQRANWGQACLAYLYSTFNTLSWGTLRQLEEPIAGELIDPPHLPWTVYAYGPNGFAREHVMPHNPNVMGYPFPPNTRANEELARNLKLKVTNYSRNLYNPRGVAYLGSGGDDHNDDNGRGGDEEDSR